jgi:hypothetical protein
LRLPAAKPIFDRQVEKVCPILTMQSQITRGDLRSPTMVAASDLKMELVTLHFFKNLINIDQRLRNRESMLVPSPPSSASTGD